MTCSTDVPIIMSTFSASGSPFFGPPGVFSCCRCSTQFAPKSTHSTPRNEQGHPLVVEYSGPQLAQVRDIYYYTHRLRPLEESRGVGGRGKFNHNYEMTCMGSQYRCSHNYGYLFTAWIPPFGTPRIFPGCRCSTQFGQKSTRSTPRDEPGRPHVVKYPGPQLAQVRDIYYYTQACDPWRSLGGLGGGEKVTIIMR